MCKGSSGDGLCKVLCVVEVVYRGIGIENVAVVLLLTFVSVTPAKNSLAGLICRRGKHSGVTG